MEAANHVWYPYLFQTWDIVSTALKFENCRDSGKDLEVVSCKKHYETLDALVETNEEIHLGFGVHDLTKSTMKSIS